MAAILGYAGLTIRCADPDAALRFYTDALQMPLAGAQSVRFPEGTCLTVEGGGEFSENASGFTHICMDTCNADDGWARALNAGAKPSRDSDVPTGDGELYGGFLRAPGGEEIELWHICRGGVRSEPYAGTDFVKAFVHAAITVPDMDAAIRFYEALGIREKLNWGWGCSMQLSNKHELEVFPKGEVTHNESGIVEVAFAVDDATALYTLAVDAGARSVAAPQNGQAIVEGPGGERIRFVEGVSVCSVDLFDD